ncbi:hypothetical protein O1R50_01685 [Glycomyces luteolus]|uniref:Uncharacterized protein n=1 Tax=Glycomyces luteolus TaxID=2670330 RepID=A0A9X3PH12_9ACTN|nr:hypothetical protein [Glycomyces luteolus]MDA1358310.1 hypothetical protein [Glycomyces luteolus]
MTTASSDPDRLRRLAATLHESIEVEYDDSAQAWTLAWADGPTVAQVRRDAEAAEPEAAPGLRYLRRYSEDAVALGAVRLAVAISADDARRRPEISPAAVETLWRDVPHPAPATERERSLVYAVVYEIHDAHHRNRASAHEICDMVARYGLAPLMRRISAALTPIETLTAHYASTHAHPAWHYRLAPMSATAAFEAVRHDPNASPELIEAALTLLPELPDMYEGAGAHLRARLLQPRDPQL